MPLRVEFVNRVQIITYVVASKVDEIERQRVCDFISVEKITENVLIEVSMQAEVVKLTKINSIRWLGLLPVKRILLNCGIFNECDAVFDASFSNIVHL